MPFLRPTVVTILALLLAPFVFAQFPSPVNNDTRTPVPGSGHDYINMFSETVDPSNGSLSVHISTPVPPSRGITIPFSFDYSSGAVQQARANSPSNGVSSAGWAVPTIGGVVLDSGGWSYRIPELTANQTQAICYINGGGGRTLTTTVWLDYIFTDPSGTRHNLGLANTQTLNPDCSYVWNPAPYSVSSGGDDFYSASLNQTTGAVMVVGVDGTFYSFATNFTGTINGVNAYLPSTIEDRNGNIVTISEGSGGNITETDTAGRPAVSTSAPVGVNGTVSISGLSNAYNVTWETQLSDYGSQYEQIGEGLNDGCSWLAEGNGPSNIVVKSIELPNGKYYTFGYDSHGLLNQISYPTGAVVTYTWTTPSVNGLILFPDNLGNRTGCAYGYYAPMVAERTVMFDGVHPALLQTFTYTTAYNAGVEQAIVHTTVYSSNGSTNLGTFKTVYNYFAAALGYSGPDDQVSFLNLNIPVEQTIQYYDYGQTNLLETVTKGWQDQFRLGCQLETYNGTQLSGTFYSYGPGLSLTDEKEYDYGQISSTSACPQAPEGGPIAAPAGPTRETAATYQVVGNASDRPCSVVTKDSSGNKAAETDYLYDGGATVCGTAGTPSVATANSPIQHDSAYAYSASPQPPRGNATSVTRQCLQSAPACSSGNPTTTYNYDETGQTTSVKDPNGNTTQYSYKDSYSSGTPSGSTNAYLTTITDPLTHSATFMYGYADGQLTSSKDVNNNQVTNYKYNAPPTGCNFADGLDRLSEADFPDGGKTFYCYDDVAPSPTVTTTKLISSSTSFSTTTTFDGIGHSVQSEITTDPDGPTYTQTTYDGTGKIYTATNPYRTTSDPTYGTATYTYDALGRATTIQRPDGSLVQTVYDQTCSASANGLGTTVTDETGNLRERCSDGLGRLIEVDEPGAGATTATAGSGTVTIGGSEQTRSGSPGAGSATVALNGSTCVYISAHGVYYAPSGTVSITVKGVNVGTGTAAWNGSCNQQNGALTISPALSGIASNLASYLTGSGAGVTATSNGATIQIVANANGSGTDYPVSSGYTLSTGDPSGSPFVSAIVPATLTGGGSSPVSDSGTVSITVDRFTANATFGSGTTAQEIAASLTSSLNAGSPVEASVSGAVIKLTAIDSGSGSNYTLTTSDTWNSADFTNPSFTATPSGSTLTGGVSGSLGNSPLVTQYAYDVLNDLTCAVQKGADPTTFTTCASASATWRPRSFVYDSLSRLTSATNPESGTLTYTYDANSNVVTRVEPKANTTNNAVTTSTYTYDALNRLLSKVHADPINANSFYGYDGAAISSCPGPVPPSITSPTNLVGRRSGMCTYRSASSWSYDPMGRPLLEARANIGPPIQTLNVSYAYYKDGSLNTLTYPSGDVLTYLVGGAGRPTQVTDSTNNYVTAATYAPQGALAGMTDGDGIVTTNIYNDRLQPILLSAGVSTGAIFSLCYDFHLRVAVTTPQCATINASTTGDNGNVFQILNKVDPTRSAVFTYDSLNRISQANTVNTTSSNCWGEVYTIDAWGNLTNRSAPSGMSGSCVMEALSATATNLNQLGGIGLLYDGAGNITTDNLGNTYTYDAENRIVTDAGVTYYYDSDGVRIEKSPGTMYWPGLGGETLTEATLAGVINEEYVYFNGERIARVDRPSGTVNYYFSNHLGSASVIATAATGGGVTTAQTDFYPFGGIAYSSGSDPNHYKFTGKERDAESGLDNFEARYDASSLGRFMTPDPMGGHLEDPQTLNRYAYVRNNPLSLTDPTGLDSYLSCTQTKDNASTCQSQTVGYDANGKAQTATVQGVTGDNGFTATKIGNQNADGTGPLVDKTTGTGTYTASANGSGVQFSNNGGQSSSTGVFVNGTPQTTFQDAGFANGNALSGFTFTLTNSKLEAGQTEAGSFTFAGTPDQAGAALQKAGFNPRSGENVGMNEYRSPGSFWTGANSSHFNVFQIGLKPWLSVPQAQGDMHFGEHNPYSPFGWVPHSSEANQ